MKILLVDDSTTMRAVQRWHLESLGLTDVTEASDGVAALAVFRPGEFDMVLADMHMPKLDGLGLVEAVREVDHDVPILMVTQESERSRVVAAVQAGVTDYLVKPYSREALRTKVEKYVGSVVAAEEES